MVPLDKDVFERRTSTSRLQNSRFFLKISKEISKAWRKSLARAKRASLTPPFDCSRVLEYAKIRTVLQSSQPEVDFLHVFAQCFAPIGSKRVIKLSSTYLVVSI